RILLAFTNPLPLSVHAISKAARAFDVKMTALAVDPKTKLIWGAIRCAKGARPACLIVTTTSMGSLLIASANRLLGYLYPESKRNLVPAAPSPFAQGAMGSFIHLPEVIVKADDAIPKSRYRWVVQELLSEASELSHGGTIILVPRSIESEVRNLYTESYPLSKA